MDAYTYEWGKMRSRRRGTRDRFLMADEPSYSQLRPRQAMPQLATSTRPLRRAHSRRGGGLGRVLWPQTGKKLPNGVEETELEARPWHDARAP